MSVVLATAAAYLMYVVLGAVFSYVLLTRAIRVAEQAATADLDRELRELVAQAPERHVRAQHSHP